MRRGNHNEVITVDGEFAGINLGWDFTAEHEFGIKGISSDYGLREICNGVFKKVLGIDARTIRMIPDYLQLIKHCGYTYLISNEWWKSGKEYTRKDLDRQMEAWGDEELVTAWSSKDFGIRVKTKDKKHLEALYEAFQNENVVITFGHDGNPFSNSGLMLVLADKLPQEYIDGQREADIDHLNLLKAAEKTGIAKRLKVAGHHYYALSPKWAGEIKSTKNGKVETKYPVIYWLNPHEQKIYNSAWVTVEDLDDWIAGKGKIVKEQA